MFDTAHKFFAWMVRHRGCVWQRTDARPPAL